MSRSTHTAAYVLSHRRDDKSEDNRLNSQHDAIQNAILGGHLIHPSVHLPPTNPAIADLGCGTGVWLNEVAITILKTDAASQADLPTLVGFDVNPNAFSDTPAPGVSLVEHDCTRPFNAEYFGKFDLVNIRGLAYAIAKEKFPAAIENASRLLKPGGYLEWLETETQLFKPYPATADFDLTFELIQSERARRGLVSYLPHFMLEQFPPHKRDIELQIVEFKLLPGGVARTDSASDRDAAINNDLSDVMLESVKLVLGASLLGKSGKEPGGAQDSGPDADFPEPRLMLMIDEVRSSGAVKMGGIFPHVVARKQSDSIRIIDAF